MLFTFIMVLSDPACEVKMVIDGQDAVLACRMVYDWQAPGRQFLAHPRLNVSLSWTGIPGSTVTTAADAATFRGTLETNTTVDVTSETTPSCNCTIRFDFSPGISSIYQYAVNSVSSTCVTEVPEPYDDDDEPTTEQRKFKKDHSARGSDGGISFLWGFLIFRQQRWGSHPSTNFLNPRCRSRNPGKI